MRTKVVLWAFICLISIISLFSLAVGAVALSMPDISKLKKKCIVATMHNVKLCKGDGNYTSISQISEHMRNAVIMSEDASFYSHGGIDTEEIKASLKHDLEQGRFARGASTITQQLAKNVFLSGEKTITRKVMEVYLAFQIEEQMSKNDILEAYLNVVEFGNNIYGVKQAARHYFQKDPASLTPAESAFLAFLLPNPKKYSQSYSRGALTPFARKTVSAILRRMNKSRRLAPEEYQAALGSLDYFPWKELPPPAPETLPEPTDEGVESEDDFNFDI